MDQTIEWESYEGEVHGYNEIGEEVVSISALMNKAYCNKWGEKYIPGREWYVELPDGSTVRGHSSNLSEAKKESLKALTGKAL